MTITAKRDTINLGDWETDLELKSAELREFKQTKRWADKRPVSYNIASSKLLLKKKEQQAPMSHRMGLVWCVIQGLTRGIMYSGQKVAHDMTKVEVKHIILIRSLIIVIGAYFYGKKDGVDFGWTTMK